MKGLAYEFARDAEQRVSNLSTSEFHERPRHAKRLIEEIYPLSRLALRFQQAGATVEVKSFENSDRADGHICIEGFSPRNFEVQVTYAGHNQPEALRLKLLAQKGYAPLAGPIQKNKRTGEIVAEMQGEDMDAPIKRVAESIRERYLAKAEKRYPPETVLLIAFDLISLSGRGWWKMLYDALDEAGGIQPRVFRQVFLFNWSSNEIQQVA